MTDAATFLALADRVERATGADRRKILEQLCVKAIQPITCESDYWGRKADRATIGGMADVIFELIEENAALTAAFLRAKAGGEGK